MTEQLYLNRELVDIIPNSISRTLQVNEVGKITQRQASYSDTISLPRTERNVKILEYLGVIGNTSRKPYSTIRADYVVNGLYLVENGIAIIQETDEFFSVNIFDGVISLKKLLAEKTLANLPYSEMNHYLDINVFQDSFSNTEGYIYGIGDFGFMDTVGTAARVRLERQIPSVFVHTIWDKIFQQAGVPYYGAFFAENQDFKTEVITPVQGYPVEDLDFTETSIAPTLNAVQITKSILTEEPIVDREVIEWTNRIDAPSYYTWINESTLKSNETFNLQARLNFTYTIDDQTDLRIEFLRNGGIIGSKLLPDTGGTSSSFSFNFNITLVPDDEISFRVRATSGVLSLPMPIFDEPEPTPIENVVSYTISNSSILANWEISDGFEIDFNQIMPQMSQLDFIRDVMKRYGLLVRRVPERLGGGFEFVKFEDILTAQGSKEDWSEKFVNIEKENYEVDYAQINRAKYNYDEDYEVAAYDGSIVIDNENAEPEDDMFESPYTIPTIGRRLLATPSNIFLFRHKVWELTDDGVRPLNSPVRLFRLNYFTGLMSVSYFEDSAAVTIEGEIPILTLNDIGLQYFLNTYYNGFHKLVNSYKELEVQVHLTALDLYRLDFFKLKYFKQTGKYYFLEKITNRIGNPISKATLIEIPVDVTLPDPVGPAPPVSNVSGGSPAPGAPGGPAAGAEFDWTQIQNKPFEGLDLVTITTDGSNNLRIVNSLVVKWDTAYDRSITGVTGTTGNSLALTRQDLPNLSLEHSHAILTPGDGLTGLTYTGENNRTFDIDTAWDAEFNSLSIGSPSHVMAIDSNLNYTTRDITSTAWTGSGYFSTGYKLTENGFLTLDSIILRGSLRAQELIIDQINAIGGTLMLSAARGKIASVDEPNSALELEDPNDRNATTFTTGDLIWIKNVDVDGGTINDVTGTVSNVFLNFIEVSLNSGTFGDINPGDVVVQRGHVSTSSRQNLIYQTATDPDGPFIRYLTGVNSHAGFTNQANIAAQTGNLTNISNASGMGFYSQNAYLTNKLIVGDLTKTSGYLAYENENLEVNVSDYFLFSEFTSGTITYRYRIVSNFEDEVIFLVEDQDAGEPDSDIRIQFKRTGEAFFGGNMEIAGDSLLSGDLEVQGSIITEFDDGNFIRGIRIEDGQLITSLNENDLGFVRTSGAEFRSGTTATSGKAEISTNHMICNNNPTTEGNRTGFSIATGIDIRQFAGTLRPAHRNGRIVYNSTTDKFQGSVNGTWVDLH